MNVQSDVVTTRPDTSNRDDAGRDDAARSGAGQDDIVGRLIDGRYRVVSQIARGGMSTVYLASDIRLDRVVALKVMHRSFAEDPGFVARFEREAKAAARLSHPNVVGVFDQGAYDGLVFLVMEYVPGHTLRDVIRTYGALEPARALGVVDQVLLALTAAHKAGYIHRDIKPENVLITDDGVAKVADFGLARAITGHDSSAQTRGLLIGTVAYLSPEQVEGGEVDERSDVYAAGVMLFELLTGRVPFTAESPLAVAYRHVNEAVPAPSTVSPDIPGYVDDLVLTATAKKPEDRFANAWAFERALAAAQNRVMGVSPSIAPEAVLFHSEVPEDLTEVLTPRHGTAVLADDPDRTTVLGPDAGVGAAGIGSGAGGGVAASAAASAPVIPHGRSQPSRRKKKIRSSRRSTRTLLVVTVLALAAVVGGFAWYLGSADYVSVPDVTGQSVADANLAMAAANLTLEETAREPSETIAEGLVIRTDPALGDRARSGSTIDAVVSSGPQLFAVPNVQGATVTVATETLQEAGFTIGGTEEAFSGEVDQGLVVGTNPAAETAQRSGTPLTLIVSLGLEPVVLPSMAGLTTADAQLRLSNLGLLSVVRQDFDATAATGTVITTEPGAGATLVPGDTVTVVASKGPAPSVVPDVVGMGQQEAVAALQAAGLVPATRNQLPIVVLDRVYSQDPAAGTELPRGSTVTITIV